MNIVERIAHFENRYILWSVVFFFKQKTAYEIGTGDWSSDVCSSDLLPQGDPGSKKLMVLPVSI